MAKVDINRLFYLFMLTAVVVVSAGLISAPSGQACQSKTSPSVIYISVTDSYGRYVPDLRAADFAISVDNTPATINYFNADDTPAAIGVLLDVSGSMRDKEPRYDALLKGLTQFAELSNPADRFFLVVMGAKPLLVTDWTQPGATLATGIEEGGKVRIKGKAYYDACAFAVGKMNETQLSKRVILVISDGEDSGSKLSRSQLRKLLEETGTLMFSIAKTDPANDALSGAGRSILEELSTVCGGRVFFPGTGSEALESFKRVAGEIRHLYAIGISADSLKGDGKLHPLKVRVNPQPVAGSRGDRPRANVSTRQHLFDPPRASSP